jgi:hypothetical protein
MLIPKDLSPDAATAFIPLPLARPAMDESAKTPEPEQEKESKAADAKALASPPLPRARPKK